MILNKKNIPIFLLFLFLGVLIGSLGWEVLERFINLLGSDFSLTMDKPVRVFDLYVLALTIRVNPGTMFGVLGGVIVFRLI